jgi:6-pyruvoyltetrahydropterin/6-carboxytetrahydropterin synthase
MKPQTLLARKTQFRCAHLYNQKQFSSQKNAEVFGACFSPHGHGHTYSLEAYFKGEIDPLTGMIINLTEVDAILNKAVERVSDKHLNFEVEEFKDKVPTTENLALFLREGLLRELQRRAPQVHLHRLRLYESEDLWVDLVEEP